MNLDILTGGVSIGNDASGDFMLSVTGIAVRTGDGGYVANDGRQMIDVTDLVIDGSQAYMYRVPTLQVDPGDLIVTSDAPLMTLFVQNIREDGSIRGIDPQTNRVQIYVQSTNIFNLAFFVKVVDVFDALGRQDEDEELSAILPLILLSGVSQGSSGSQASGGSQGILDNPLTAVFLFEALSHKGGRGKLLTLLIAMQATQGSGTPGYGTSGNIFLPLLLLASSPRRRDRRELEEREERKAARGEGALGADLVLKLAEEQGKRIQAEKDLALLLAGIREGQAETEAVDESESSG